MPENETVNLLLSLSRTCALQCLVALWAIGPLPVTTLAVSDAVGESEEAVKRGLRRLRTRGLVVCDDIGGRETNWRLAPATRQLPLPLDLLDITGEPTVSSRGILPCGDFAQQNRSTGATGQPALVCAPAPLQVGQPSAVSEQAPAAQARLPHGIATGLNAGNSTAETTPVFPESATPRKPESARAGIIISFNNSESDDSINNNKTRQNPTPQKAESPAERVLNNPRIGVPDPDGRAAEKKPRHVADVLRALRKRGQPVLADDPFPPDLRQCVERLVAIHCPLRRAELAVARSPFDAPTLLAEIARWKARKASPEGRSITQSGFPFLVASRLESGDHCPSGDYEIEPEPAIEESIQPEMPADVPDAPPPFIRPDPQPIAHDAPSGEASQWWMATLTQIRLELSKGVFDTWLSAVQLIGYDSESHTFTLGVPTPHQRDWVANRLAPSIRRALHSYTGRPAQVIFETCSALAPASSASV